jgi:multidrug efflux pump subunit AcrA (membrane-fusion protein)
MHIDCQIILQEASKVDYSKKQGVTVPFRESKSGFIASNAISAVRSPNSMRTMAYIITGLLILIFIVLTYVPWVQTVAGKGQVTALIPGQRPQNINAQITGRLVRWHVQEGQHVEEGDTIAVLQDIDSKFLDSALLENQQSQLEAIQNRRNSIMSQLDALRRQISAESSAREASVRSSLEKVQQAKQKRIATEERIKQNTLDLSVAKQRFQDRKTLFDKGLLSQRQFENAQMELQRADVAYNSQIAEVEGARRMEGEALENVKNKESEGTSKIVKAMADESKALETVASIDNSLFKGRSEMNAMFSRRSASIVRAPSKGKIVRLYTIGSGETVKQGEKLAILAPEMNTPAVELTISGNDAPLITKGRKVRVQFDGFPAFIIRGWPGASVGTFGGVISVIDAIEDESFGGQFRIIVKPDPNDEPWPSSSYLRPGTQASGWMQLNVVSLGWEIWRQLNGFPPTVKKPSNATYPKEVKDADAEKE